MVEKIKVGVPMALDEDATLGATCHTWLISPCTWHQYVPKNITGQATDTLPNTKMP